MAKYTFWFAGICVIMFVMQLVVPGFTEALVLNGEAWFQPWRFVSAIFLHGDIGHIIYNMFALVLFGFMLEQMIGGKRFLIVFLGTGIFANLISVNFYSSSLGASGAIFGVIGALVLIRPGMTVWAFNMPMPMFMAGILWAVGDLIGAVAYFSGNALNSTGNLAHLSGMALGLLFGFLFKDKLMNNGERKIVYRLNEEEMRNWEDRHLR